LITVDPPTRLPGVDHLSVSSLNLLAKCPERWRRRYLEREYEPPNGKMILGSSVGAAEGRSYSQVIETGELFTLEQVQDEFSAEWEDRIVREEIDWGSEKPGALKDSGVAVLDQYHTVIAPTIIPVSVEREFRFAWPGLDWHFTGFFDLEEASDDISDLKVRGRRLALEDADVDLQPAAYMFARRAEGSPARNFNFHTMVRPPSRSPYAEIVTTGRTNRQLDAFGDRVLLAASELAWRAENDVWSGAVPGSWWCSERFCGYWNSCPFGGLR